MDDDAMVPVMISVSMSGILFCVILAVVGYFVFIKKDKDSGGGGDGDDGDNDNPGGETSGWKKTGITFYGQGGEGDTSDDNGKGISGVDLYNHDRANIKLDGKKVYPGAVYQADGPSYLYKVIEVRSDKFTNNKSILLHIVDVCGFDADVCKENVGKHGFLVDIHYTGFKHVGLDDGLIKGEFRVRGEIRPKNIPKSAWTKEAQAGKDYILCSCSNECRDKKWKPLKGCR